MISSIILPLTLGLAALALGKHTKILLGDVEVLTFHKDSMTTARRLDPIPQLDCIGGSARLKADKVETVQCKNMGFDGQDYNWECKTQLPETLKLGRTWVLCEGWNDASDPYILAGSCALEYELNYADSPAYKRVLFSDLNSLTFKEGQMTLGRRTDPVPQLECVGGTALLNKGPHSEVTKDQLEAANKILGTVTCTRTGHHSKYDPQDFKCVADLPTDLRLGATEIVCEGWDNPDDPYVLEKSCQLRYQLNKVLHRPTPIPSRPPVSKPSDQRQSYFNSMIEMFCSVMIYVLLCFVSIYCLLGFCNYGTNNGPIRPNNYVTTNHGGSVTQTTQNTLKVTKSSGHPGNSVIMDSSTSMSTSSSEVHPPPYYTVVQPMVVPVVQTGPEVLVMPMNPVHTTPMPTIIHTSPSSQSMSSSTSSVSSNNSRTTKVNVMNSCNPIYDPTCNPSVSQTTSSSNTMATSHTVAQTQVHGSGAPLLVATPIVQPIMSSPVIPVVPATPLVPTVVVADHGTLNQQVSQVVQSNTNNQNTNNVIINNIVLSSEPSTSVVAEKKELAKEKAKLEKDKENLEKEKEELEKKPSKTKESVSYATTKRR